VLADHLDGLFGLPAAASHLELCRDVVFQSARVRGSTEVRRGPHASMTEGGAGRAVIRLRRWNGGTGLLLLAATAAAAASLAQESAARLQQ
jgi:hypothetical protein